MTDPTPDQARPQSRIRWELHLQTVLIALLIAGVTGLIDQGRQILTTQAAQIEAQKAMADKFADLKVKLERMDARFSEFPSRTEADLRWRGLETRVDEHTRRIERLEGGPRR